MCINWKVVGALAVAAIGLYLVAPSVVLSALPLLLVAACPLSMLFMAKTMTGGPTAASPPAPAVQPAEAPPNQAGQIVQLRAQLQRVAEQQASLARQIAELQATERSPLPEAMPPLAELAPQPVPAEA